MSSPRCKELLLVIEEVSSVFLRGTLGEGEEEPEGERERSNVMVGKLELEEESIHTLMKTVLPAVAESQLSGVSSRAETEARVSVSKERTFILFYFKCVGIP